MNKKSGGIRPIAVGFTLRRLVSKCANTHAIARLSTFFSPIQLGVGTPGGCEAAVHAARRFLETIPNDNVVVKLSWSFINKSKRNGYCSPDLPDFNSLCTSMKVDLFNKVLKSQHMYYIHYYHPRQSYTAIWFTTQSQST